MLTANRGCATNEGMEIQKAIDLIEKSEHIALLLPGDPDVDALVSAEVLGRVFETAGKEVGVINTPGHIKQPPHQSLKKLATSSMLPKEFVVSLDTSNHPVSQLRYETEENRINVIFSPRTASLKEPLISFREGRILCDAVFAFGIPDIENVNHADLLGPAFFTETPIVNIDVSEKNKRYGEINLVNPEKASSAEIVYELAVTLKEEPLEQELCKKPTNLRHQRHEPQHLRPHPNSCGLALTLMRRCESHRGRCRFHSCSLRAAPQYEQRWMREAFSGHL